MVYELFRQTSGVKIMSYDRNSTPDDVVFVLLIFTFLMGGLIGFCLGSGESKRKIREEAYESGVGYWDINKKTGKRTFRFIEIK